MAQRFDLTREMDRAIDQGADFVLELTFLDADGQAIDISSNTYDGDLKRTHEDAAAVESFTFNMPGGGTDGRLDVSLSDAETSALEAGTYVYDFRELAAGLYTRILEGVAEVTKGVTTT